MTEAVPAVTKPVTRPMVTVPTKMAATEVAAMSAAGFRDARLCNQNGRSNDGEC